MKKLHELAARARHEMVVDIIRWPDWKIESCLHQPGGAEALLAERAKFLKTKKGKRLLALVKEYEDLIYPEWGPREKRIRAQRCPRVVPK